MGEKRTAAAPGGDVLERVLASLLDLSFVLTDREGLVSRWTKRAEQLFGLGAAEAVGRPLLETFGAGKDEAPAAGQAHVSASHRDGDKFKVEVTFIPVPMSHSLEFNGFLESLESDHRTDAVMRRVNSQHSDVLDWIGSVVTDGVPLHRDELTAGTIVAFRPLGEVPWLQAEAAPEAQAPHAGKGQPGLADALDRAVQVLARSDALGRTLDEAGEAVEQARATADAAHAEATSAASGVAELAEENAGLRSELERAHSELGELRRRLDSTSETVTSDELAALRAELEAIRSAPPAVTREDVEALRDELRQLHESRGGHEAAGDAAQRAEEALEAVRALADELRAEVQEARDEAARARAGASDAAETAAVEAKVARVQAEAARVHSEEAGAHAQAAREVAEVWASAAERHRGGRDENGDAQTAKRLREEKPSRVSRPGFDDAESPMAVIALDGRFRELNPGFAELVGHSEPDFQSASWPPVADRGQLDHHRDQMRAMLAGEVESVEVNTGYVHAQGLLVPVAGTLSLVRDDDDEPSHFLLSVGVPAPASAS